jgi:hypothetical protein
MSGDRSALARRLLQQVVYRSRGAQAAGSALGASGGGPAGCGLGAGPAVVLELDAEGRELFESIFPGGLAGADLQRVQRELESWVRRQDALDRQRNHFLKDFRHRHGFDRRAYPPEILARYEAGLEELAAELEGELRAAGSRLIEGT